MPKSQDKAPLQQKKETHAIFDRLWHLLPVTDRQRAQYRSTLYRVWGAVLAGELGNVDGVINPSEGGQHIRNMQPVHQEKCQEFIHHLIRHHRGNVTSLAADLSKWSYGFKSESKTPNSIQSSLNDDVFIRNIRQAIGIAPYSIKKESGLPARTIKAEKPKTAFSMLCEEETDMIGKMAIAEDVAMHSPVSAITTSKEKELTAIEHFVEGVIAKIEGNTEQMLMHFDSAANKNHAEAAWHMWEYWDKNSASPEENRKALEYLDIASRGLYRLAPLKAQELYNRTPSITTPYLETLQHQAQQKGASSATMNALGEYYSYMIDDVVKGEYYYKKAIEKDNNPDALSNLSALYVAFKEWFFISNEAYASHANYINSHASVDAKASFMLERRNIMNIMQNIRENQDYTQAEEFSKQGKDRGSVAETILYHADCLGQMKRKGKNSRKGNVNTSLQYISAIACSSSGSTGTDSDYNIDYTGSDTGKNAILAQNSTLTLPIIIGYYKSVNDLKSIHYWETYLQCSGEELTTAPAMTESKKNRTALFIEALMGSGVKVAYKLKGGAFITTAALFSEASPGQMDRAKIRLTQHDIPFRQEADGSIRIPETTYEVIFQAYSTMMRAHQARNTASPLPKVAGAAPIAHNKKDSDMTLSSSLLR